MPPSVAEVRARTELRGVAADDGFVNLVIPNGAAIRLPDGGTPDGVSWSDGAGQLRHEARTGLDAGTHPVVAWTFTDSAVQAVIGTLPVEDGMETVRIDPTQTLQLPLRRLQIRHGRGPPRRLRPGGGAQLHAE
jgi:hypothetical protein